MRAFQYASAFLTFLIPAAMAGCDSPSGGDPNAPPAAGAVTLVVAEDSSAVFDWRSATSDADGDALTLVRATTPAHGRVVQQGGEWMYVPESDFHGADAFDFYVSDGINPDVEGSVLVTVTPVADAPVAVDDAAEVQEDGSASIDVLANDSDVDGDILAVTDVRGAGHGNAVVVENAVLYTGGADYFGPDSVMYVVSDGALADTGTLALTVVAVNDRPRAADDDAVGREDEALGIAALANDTDPEGQAVLLAGFGEPSHGTVTWDPPELTYHPEADYHGADAFDYVATDDLGGTDTATVRVTLTAVPDAPVAVPDTGSTFDDTPLLIDVLANDVDVDGDALAIASVGPTASGIAVVEDAGIRFTPEEDVAGEWTFEYVVDDGTGLADTTQVVVRVALANGAPTAEDDALTVPEDGTGSVAVLANDTDPDGDALTVVGFGDPEHGSVSGDDGTLTYRAAERHYNGPDSFHYVVSDGSAVDTATVHVTVTPVNDPPLAMPDTAVVTQDASVLIDVLANDLDVDGDPLEPGSTTYYPDGIIAPTRGSAAWEDGRIRYTPAPGVTGTDSLIYFVSDGIVTGTGATVLVTIQPVAGVSAAAAGAAELGSGVGRVSGGALGGGAEDRWEGGVWGNPRRHSFNRSPTDGAGGISHYGSGQSLYRVAQGAGALDAPSRRQ